MDRIVCSALIAWKGKYLAIKVKKSYMLPSVDWKKGESFADCARRAVLELTGHTAKNFKLVFKGVADDLSYGYTFEARIDVYIPRTDLVLIGWEELRTSDLFAYYELLEEAVLKPSYLHEPTRTTNVPS